jgi:hypothetical protein
MAARSLSRSCQRIRCAPGSSARNSMQLAQPRWEAIALLAGGVDNAQRRVLEHAHLAVALGAGGAMVAGHFMPAHVYFGQVVALVGEAQVAGLLDEECPTGHPQPEFLFLMRVQGEVVGFFAVALEEAGLGLPTSMMPRKAAYAKSSIYSFGLGVAVATKRYGTLSNSRMNSRKVLVPPKPRSTLASSRLAAPNSAGSSLPSRTVS